VLKFPDNQPEVESKLIQTRSHHPEPSKPMLHLASEADQGSDCEDTQRQTLPSGEDREAVRRQKLELLGHSYTALVHQIRTPLTVAGLYAELLQPRCESDAESKAALDGIVNSLHTIENYMRNCLIFVKGELQERRNFTITEIVERIEASCQRYFSRAEYQVIRTEAAVGSVSGDLSALISAIDNLLENATQAIDDCPRLSININCEECTLVMELSDNGPGIPEEMKQKVKQPFVSGRKEGTGLGLAIAESVIRAHRGVLSFAPNAGGGTTARIALPLAPSVHTGNG